MTKALGEFELNVNQGDFTDSEIIVMLGENGTGKTTFIRLMAGLLTPDSGGTMYHIIMYLFCSSIYTCRHLNPLWSRLTY